MKYDTPDQNTILTYTGVRFNPLEAEAQDIRIEDIAHALSLMTRANGHLPHFYSVAQHSLNCASEALARGCSWACCCTTRAKAISPTSPGRSSATCPSTC